MEESDFTDQFANTDSLETATAVVGFEQNRRAWNKTRSASESDDWTDWTLVGSAVDYRDNKQFADSQGCPFKLV